MKLFLIGLLGSGKSVLGKELSGLMNLPFIDLDHAIEVKEGAKVSEVFSAKGEAHFRKIEAAALRDQSNQKEFVMATGGGTPCFHDNMKFINEAGTSVFLDTPISEIVKRLKGEQLRSRPLLANVREGQLPDALATMHDARIKFYEQADIRVTGASITAKDILDILKARM
jgi:shikimate kinase